MHEAVYYLFIICTNCNQNKDESGFVSYICFRFRYIGFRYRWVAGVYFFLGHIWRGIAFQIQVFDLAEIHKSRERIQRNRFLSNSRPDSCSEFTATLVSLRMRLEKTEVLLNCFSWSHMMRNCFPNTSIWPCRDTQKSWKNSEKQVLIKFKTRQLQRVNCYFGFSSNEARKNRGPFKLFFLVTYDEELLSKYKFLTLERYTKVVKEFRETGSYQIQDPTVAESLLLLWFLLEWGSKKPRSL